MARAIGDRVIVAMQYGEETVTIISVDVDARGYDTRDSTGNEFWISADDVLRDDEPFTFPETEKMTDRNRDESLEENETLVHYIADGVLLCGEPGRERFNATNYDADAVSCGLCRRALAEEEERARATLLPTLPPNLPREAARAAGLLLLLIAKGVGAEEEECDGADLALYRLGKKFPEAARALSEYHAEAV